MVTGLSDTRSSHRHGVVHRPTASPPPTLRPPSPPLLLLLLLLLSTEGSSKPPCLDAPSLFVRPRSASDRLLQIYSKADNKLERGYHLVSSRPEGQSIAGHARTHTHIYLWSIVSAPAESGIAGLATHQRNSVTSFPHPPEVCSGVTSCWLTQCVCPQ